jgi:alpha-2-macroglobulin
MSHLGLKILRYILSLTLLFGYKIAYCQVRYPIISADSLKKAGLQKSNTVATDQFKRLEKAIGSKEALQQSQQQLLLLKQQAIKSHDDIMLARSLYELMKINDLRTEDSLYFKNSAFMDTLLNSGSSSPALKAIIHVLRAQRINNFDHRPLRFNRAAYRSKNIPVDYASLTTDQLDSIWTKDLTAALAYNSSINDLKKLLWLSSNPDIFLFNPRFADIVLSEYINQAALKKYYNFNKGAVANMWPSLPSPEIRKKLDSIAEKDKDISILAGYQRWLSFNNGNNATAAFIESLARKYIFSFTASDSLSYQSYISYLQTQTASPYAAVNAHSVYQLCLIWNEDGNKYFNNPFGYAYLNHGAFDKKYQYLPDSALRLFEKNKALMAGYSRFNDILTLMADQIKAPGLSISMDNKFIPNEDIPIKALYKNTDTLYYRIIRINAGEPSGHPDVTAPPELINRKPAASGFFALPLPLDHNKHAVYLKLSALPAGHYRLLFNYSGLKANGRSIYNIPFQVTSVTAINSDERIYVLDRKTGTPLAGAGIQAFKKGTSVAGKVSSIVKKEGYIIMPDNIADSVTIAYKGDTLGYSYVIHDNDRSEHDNIYDKDLDDELVDFYDDKLTMDIFTDRSIYRPGQTVHYKIILFTRNPQTGDPIIFNRQNLGGGIFRDRVNAWLKKNHAIITLSDPFNHNVDSARMVPNDFGSFAGSFTLPKTAATGEWDIDGKPDRDNQNEGRFRVEEYKRPTIELSMEKQKKMLRPGEPFTIKLKLRSFSGSDLGNIPIKYTINRTGVLPSPKITNSRFNNNYLEGKLSDTIGYTNEKGELSMPLSDTLLAKYKWGDTDADNYNYSINATATDPTGETSEINESLNISSRPVKINIQLSKIYGRQSLPRLSVNTTADFEGVAGRKVAIKIYAVSDPDLTGLNFKNTDQWYYTEPEWNKWFPGFTSNKPFASKRTLIIDTIINTTLYEKLVLPKSKLNTGYYELIADCRADDNALIGRLTYNFKVFDSAAGTAPGDDLDYMPVNTAKPGAIITWYSFNKTNTYTIYQVLYQAGKKKVIKNIYSQSAEQPGLQRWIYQVPADAKGNLAFTRIYVSNNQIIKNNKTVYLYKVEAAQPEIIIEKYRKVMVPGAEETFTLSVKTQNENIAAELMTTLYDVSLDKLNEHTWNIPNQREYHPNPRAEWPYLLSLQQQAGNFAQNTPVEFKEVQAQQYGYFSELNGKVAGLSITSAQGLNEVVVVGYGTERRLSLAGSLNTIMIRGNSSLADYKQPLIIVDGEIYTGGLDKLNVGAITQAIVLKGAEASAIYGSRAAEGVLIISTKGPIVLPEAPEPVVKIRKNFNETAFFLPQVHAGADGYYTFSFTMPESATEWNWKMLAHTKKSQFAYLERKLQTQLNLMVQPNMPRLLYQGDRLSLQSRITNLDTINVAGNITCKIEDAVTGEDITPILLTNNQQAFSVNKKSSATASFQLNVPTEQLNPLKIVITASTPGAADAEEHIIPVLSSKILVRQSLPVKFDRQSAITIPSVKLPSDAQLFGIGISIVQKPLATLINALPWLANYSYDCAEQTFNKLNALAIALRLMQKDTLAQKIFTQASRIIEKEKPKDNPLPDEMAAEATPWLSIGTQSATQQQQLFKVLDTAASKISIEKYLERLYKLQQPDGGLAWFEGGKSNEYISAYVLAGFGQLKQQGWHLSIGENVRFQQFINDLYKYNKDQVLRSDTKNYDMYQVYALSYWLIDRGAPTTLTGHVNMLLNEAWKNADKQSLDQQALLIINTFRYNISGNPLYQKAQQQLENINQLAIQDGQNGLRWKDISDAEELNTSTEETMALLAEAFELSPKYPQMNVGMIKWLLTTRQDQHWQTTKATAAAIGMLQKEKGSAIGENKAFSTEIAGQHLYVSDDLLIGVPAAFVTAKQLPAAITLQQQGTTTSGALTWYYFAKPASLDTLNKAVHISKQFYSYDKIKGWIPLTNDSHLKTGDKVRVKLTIETASRLKFVHISDPRAAAFEPADKNSGYQYNDGLSYYQSVKDTGMEIFTESVPRGISEISYEIIVAMDGEFTSGPARLQCMYQPSVTAYSTAQTIVTNL